MMRFHIFVPAFLRRLHFGLNFLFVGRTPSSGQSMRTCATIVSASSFWTANTSFKSLVKFPTRVPRRCQRGEPGRDPHRFARFTHAAFDEMRHAEFLADLWAVAFLPLNENADVRRPRIPGIFCSTVALHLPSENIRSLCRP